MSATKLHVCEQLAQSHKYSGQCVVRQVVDNRCPVAEVLRAVCRQAGSWQQVTTLCSVAGK